MTAEQIFDLIRARIDRGCVDEDWHGVIAEAEALGMRKADTSNGYVLAYDLSVTDALGNRTSLEFYSRDTSRPFQVKADIHVFELRLWRDEAVVREHTNRFLG
ncbi:MAG: hypothetical protein V4618_15645 [Pseudomonadota bacterium]